MEDNPLWQQAGLTDELMATLQQQVQGLLAEPLYWFPIRHHSPACAWQVRQSLLQRRPRQVFIEIPAQFQDVLPLVTASDTHPPVALYSSFTDTHNGLGLAGITTPSADIMPSMGSWFPLLAYSPEYIALQTAAEIGAEVICIDLPAYARPSFREPETDSISQDEYITASLFFHALAEAGGYHSWDECWDSLFEPMGAEQAASTEEFRYQLASFCAAARSTTPLDEDTWEREQFMWRQIQAQVHRPGEAMVVCGGLHVLMEKGSALPPDPPPPDGKEYHTLVPYTYERLSTASGYQAGNRAPYFYQLQWQARQQGMSPHETVYRTLQRLISYARQRGAVLSSADTVASAQHALMLCRLRNRAQPVLDDLLDALITCCCKGDPQHTCISLQQALQQALTGQQRGQVSAQAGQLPLVKDVYQWLQHYGLQANNGYARTVKLDKRQPEQRQAAAFLHRLAFLRVPFAECKAKDVDHGLVFQENWSYLQNVGMEERLIELSPFGDSVEAVALRQLELALFTAHDMASISQLLLQALKMELVTVVMNARQLARQVLLDDQRFVSLAQAVANLILCRQYLTLENYHPGSLDPLIADCFIRTSHSLLTLHHAPEQEAEQIVQCLLHLLQIQRGDELPELDRALFSDYLNQAEASNPPPFLRGCLWGILLEIRQRTPAQLAGEISQWQYAPADQVVAGCEFIRGAMHTAQVSILLGATDLVMALDQLLQQADAELFDAMAVHLRAGFEQLGQSQRLRFADAVARHYGLREAEDLRLETSVQGAQIFAQLDQQVAAIMQGWACFRHEETTP